MLKPYLPMVKATPAPAPIGASRITIATMRNSASSRLSMTRTTGLPRSPSLHEGDAQQHRDQDDLQHGALGEGVHDRRGDDVHQEADEAGLRLGRLARSRRWRCR